MQGVTNADKSFTATLIGNQNPNGTGPLVDKTTGTGTYTASANGSGVQFSNNGGQTSSSGVFVNGTPETTFQDAGFANGGALSGFSFTLTKARWRRDKLRPDILRSPELRPSGSRAGEGWIQSSFWRKCRHERVPQSGKFLDRSELSSLQRVSDRS